MNTEKQRRTDRVMIRMPVLISATDVTVEKFCEQGHTLTINRHGATVALNRILTPGLHLKICPVTSKRESSALVIGQLGSQSNIHVYGIALLEPSSNLWGIQFPPLPESEEGLAKALLECGACRAREVVFLNELETDVFEGNHSLPRSCSQCGTWTLWVQTANELRVEDSAVNLTTLADSSVAPAGRAENKRKHVYEPSRRNGQTETRARQKYFSGRCESSFTANRAWPS